MWKTWCKFSFQCNQYCSKNYTISLPPELKHWDGTPCMADQVKGRVFISELEILMIEAISSNKEKL